MWPALEELREPGRVIGAFLEPPLMGIKEKGVKVLDSSTDYVSTEGGKDKGEETEGAGYGGDKNLRENYLFITT